MTIEEFNILTKESIRHIIAQNIMLSATDFALKYGKTEPNAAIIATQIKYLQRSKEKLPHFYAVKAIIPSLSYEQCSSALAASMKTYSGKTCLDLTFGLGVDTWQLAQNFEQVTAIERSAVLTAIGHFNFDLLGTHNVDIICADAQDYIQNYQGEPFDLIYLDPARRDETGKKIFLPQDCEPNFIEMLPRLKAIGRKIVVKLSPLYDVDAALKQFDDLESVGIVSIDNECKELLLTFQGASESLTVTPKLPPFVFINAYFKGVFYTFKTKEKPESTTLSNDFEGFHYILEPDVAFYKARLISDFLSLLPDEYPVFLTAKEGFILFDQTFGQMPARQFRILQTFDYQPKKLQQFLKNERISRLNIVQRCFLHATADIRKALKIKEGGDLFLICTQIAQTGQKVAWLAERVQ